MTAVIFDIALGAVLFTLAAGLWFYRDRIGAYRAQRRARDNERRLVRKLLEECQRALALVKARAAGCSCKEANSIVETAEQYMNFAQRKRVDFQSCSCSPRGFIQIAMSELARAGKVLDAAHG